VTELVVTHATVPGKPSLDGALTPSAVVSGAPLPAAGSHEVFDALTLKPVDAGIFGKLSGPVGTVERYLADVKRQLREKGLPTSAPHVRIAVMEDTGHDGRLLEHGEDVARAVAGPVGLAQDADLRVFDDYKVPTLVQRYDQTASEMIKRGDCSFAELGQCLADDLVATVEREREVLSAAAASLPKATDGRTRLIVNVSSGAIPIKRAMNSVDELYNPESIQRLKGSRLENELLDLVKGQPDYKDALRRALAGAVHDALRRSPTREALAAARGRLEDTVREVRREGVLPFYSAGNSYDYATKYADDTDSLSLKAVKGMIVVGATELGDSVDRAGDRSTAWSSGSASQPRYVTLSTVGQDVPVGPGGSLVDGTSFSAPIAASVAALMLEANPSLTPDDVERLMTDPRAVRDLPGTRDGAGELDPVAAVELARQLRG
jgi:hypothetical protein